MNELERAVLEAAKDWYTVIGATSADMSMSEARLFDAAYALMKKDYGPKADRAADMADVPSDQGDGQPDQERGSAADQAVTSGPSLITTLPASWRVYQLRELRIVRGNAVLAESHTDHDPKKINPLVPASIAMRGEDLCDIWIEDDGYVVYLLNREKRGLPPCAANELDDEQVRRATIIIELGLYPLKKEGGSVGDGATVEPEITHLDNHDLWAHLPVIEGVPLLRDNDPFDGEAISIAELVLQRYHTANPTARYWSEEIGPYPVPAWLDAQAQTVCGVPYYQLEQRVAAYLEERFDELVDVLLVRSWCAGFLQRELDPHARIVRMPSNVQAVHSYMLAIMRREGMNQHPIPTTPRVVTVLQYPWRLSLPECDSPFGEIDLPSEREAIRATYELDVPAVYGLDVINALRQNISKRKAKAMADKKALWEKGKGGKR